MTNFWNLIATPRIKYIYEGFVDIFSITASQGKKRIAVFVQRNMICYLTTAANYEYTVEIRKYFDQT